MNIFDEITMARQAGASDLHLVRGLPPRCRVDGALRDLEERPLTAEDCLDAARTLAGEDFPRLEEDGELDRSATLQGVRCRLNLFRQQGTYSAAVTCSETASRTWRSWGSRRRWGTSWTTAGG